MSNYLDPNYFHNRLFQSVLREAEITLCSKYTFGLRGIRWRPFLIEAISSQDFQQTNEQRFRTGFVIISPLSTGNQIMHM